MAVVLALLSAASWGTGDFLGGMAARRRPALDVLLFSQLGGLLFAILLEAGVRDPWPGVQDMWPALVAGAAGALALGCFYRALAVGTMSIVAPTSATAVVVPVVAGIATGDRPSAAQVAGIVLAFGGIMLASREAEEAAVADVPARPADAPAGPASARLVVGLSLVAALGFGVFLTLIAGASDASVPWALVCARSASIALIVPVWLARDRARVVNGPDTGPIWTLGMVGLFDVGANALYAVASTKGLLSVVSVLGSLYPVTTVLLAWTILHERLARTQRAGVGLAFVGVALLAA